MASALCLATACAGPERRLSDAQDYVECVEPRPQMCTMEYAPVCAEVQDKTRKTYSSGCTACADPNVAGYVDGPCPADAP